METEIIRWGVFGIMGIAIWFLKRTIGSFDSRLAEQQKEIAEIRRDYLHRDDFKEFKVELRAMFDEIKQDIRELKKSNG